MNQQPAPVVIEAIAPSWNSSKIHLHVAGYLPKGRPGITPKKRGLKITPMCGVYAPSTAVRVPIGEALLWPKWRPGGDGPFPTPPVPERRWCLACLGHAADLLELTEGLVLAIAAEQAFRSSGGVSVQGQMFTRAAYSGRSDAVVTAETAVVPDVCGEGVNGC